MLGKLMKYEFKSTARLFLPFYAVILIVSVVNRLLINFNTKTPVTLGVALSVTLIVGIIVLTLLLTLDRFYKNLLQNEGYLMFTLPVKTECLILSKLIVSAIWFLASAAVVMASISIMALTKVTILEFSYVFEMVTTLEIVQIAILSVLHLIMGILNLYACMSLSLLVNRHRILFSFGAYVVISTLLQIGAVIALYLGDGVGITSMLGRLSADELQNVVMICAAIVSVCLSVAMFLITRYMLKNKLNLQ